MLSEALNRRFVEQAKQELSPLIASAEAMRGAISVVPLHDVLDVGEADERKSLLVGRPQAQPALPP